MSRSIVLTGATGRFGKILTRYFLSKGDQVIAVGRSAEALEKLSLSNRQRGKKLKCLKLDLITPDIGGQLVQKLSELKIFPNCLVNNARNFEFLQLSSHGFAPRSHFLNELNLGVVVSYELTMALAYQKKASLRSVVNIGSIYGSVAPHPGLYKNPEKDSPIHYGVTKAALAHLTKELAVRLAPKGIRVNCAAFGGLQGRVDKSFMRRYASLCPSGRMLKEKEIPGPIDMLLSEAASGVTGHVLMVDGGWTSW